MKGMVITLQPRTLECPQHILHSKFDLIFFLESVRLKNSLLLICICSTLHQECGELIILHKGPHKEALSCKLDTQWQGWLQHFSLEHWNVKCQTSRLICKVVQVRSDCSEIQIFAFVRISAHLICLVYALCTMFMKYWTKILWTFGIQIQ